MTAFRNVWLCHRKPYAVGEASVIEVYLEGDCLRYRPMELEEIGDALLVQ